MATEGFFIVLLGARTRFYGSTRQSFALPRTLLAQFGVDDCDEFAVGFGSGDEDAVYY